VKQVVNEACNYPMNFKISMIPPLKLTKIIDEKEQHGESSCQTLNLKPCFTKSK